MYRIFSGRTTASHCPPQPSIFNCPITKLFSFYEEHIFGFTTMFCSTNLFFKVRSFIWKDGRNLYKYQFFTFIAKVYPANCFVAEIQMHDSIIFHCYFVLLLIVSATYRSSDFGIGFAKFKRRFHFSFLVSAAVDKLTARWNWVDET